MKRRIIIDLRRRQQQIRAPRAPHAAQASAVRMATFQCEEEAALKGKYYKFGWDQEDWAREWVVIDVSDAFMHLAVAEEELAHCMAPGRVRGESEGGDEGGGPGAGKPWKTKP